MRRLLTAAACLLALAATAAAQELYTSDEFGFELELPTQTWRALPRGEGSHRHAEFIYGDRSDGLLRVRREIVSESDGLPELADRDRDNKMRLLPGLVAGRREDFPGRLNGISVPYEYTHAGKPWVARIYYLRADPRTVYVLHFTGRRETLVRLRSQTDSIARSFRVK
jgi:hypothetical protein